MYYRSQGYPYRKNVNLPPNYGGNAFLDKTDETTQENEDSSEILQDEKKSISESDDITYEEAAVQTQTEPAAEAGLFKNSSFLGGKIGTEELLLLAVIFLISDSEGSDDILWLLVLLLFIK